MKVKKQAALIPLSAVARDQGIKKYLHAIDQHARKFRQIISGK
jgi:hypothetical protein